MKIQSTFRDMVIRSFVEGIYFQGYGILVKIFKGIWDTWDPLTGPQSYTCTLNKTITGLSASTSDPNLAD